MGKSSLVIPAYTKTVPTLANTVKAPEAVKFDVCYFDSRGRIQLNAIAETLRAVALFNESIASGYEVKNATPGEGVTLARPHKYKPFREFVTFVVVE